MNDASTPAPSKEEAPARLSTKIRLLCDWAEVSTRDRALVRLLLDLQDLIDASGAEVEASWFDWSCAAACDVRSYLVGKGIML